MKGYKTVVFGLVLAIAPAALTYLAGVDWTSLGISPSAAAAIGLAIIGLRSVTDTAMGKKE
jgi:hypothetical protein